MLRDQFDADNLVANAGLILPATSLSISTSKPSSRPSSADRFVGRVPARPSHWGCTGPLMIAGGDSLDDSNVLGAGSLGVVLGHVS